QNDSVPLFNEDETLTRNQVIAREFLGLALLDRDEEVVEVDICSSESCLSEHTIENDSFDKIRTNVLSVPPSPTEISPPAVSASRSDDALAQGCPCGPLAPSSPGTTCECQSESALRKRDEVLRQVVDEVQRTGSVAAREIVVGGSRCQITQATSNVTVVNMDFCGGVGGKREKKQQPSRAIPEKKKAKGGEKAKMKISEFLEKPSGGIPKKIKAELEKKARGYEEERRKEQPSEGIQEVKVEEGEQSEGGEDKKVQTIEKEQALTGPILSSVTPKEIVEYRLKKRPCAECARIWEEYGVLIGPTSDMAIEFAFRSHPLHPAVTLLNVTLECFKAHLVVESDEAQRPVPARPVRFPAKDQLREVAQELETAVAVPLYLGERHSFACVENYQVAMHSRVDEVKAVYEKFMEICRKRDAEGRLFYCDICRLVLPSSRHFRLHLLSEAHDKKTAKAPIRQTSLYNPLCQMVCFIDAVTLMQRKKMKKIEKKEEKKKERKVKREKEEHKSISPKTKKAEGELKMEIKFKDEEKKKRRTMRQEEPPLVVVDESEDSPWVKDRRGFLVYRMAHPKAIAAQKKEI
ncbi:hypothetical protein PENTCL1PPCAC_4121, partial [Pristionchus entomophagus]